MDGTLSVCGGIMNEPGTDPQKENRDWNCIYTNALWDVTQLDKSVFQVFGHGYPS